MKPRGRYAGALLIMRFNWPYYLTASVALLAAGALGLALDHPMLRAGCLLAWLGSGYFLFVSLAVSHLIYDRSDLYRFGWLGRALGGHRCQSGVFCHTGLDEVSAHLRAKLAPANWTVLDHYDPERMTEPSIRRARQLCPPCPETLAAGHATWPLPSASQDVVFGLLAVHELRSEAERSAWFTEARRCLRPGGRVVLVEHLRDFANLLAFGPGFMHFHSAASWQRCWQAAGLRATDQFPVTPWIRIFILQIA